MKTVDVALSVSLAFLIGVAAGLFNPEGVPGTAHKRVEEEVTFYKQRVASLELQRDISIASGKECRSIVSELEIKGYIEPRPLVLEEENDNGKTVSQ